MPPLMDPVLLTFHAPVHDLDVVGRHVVRAHLGEHLVRWYRITGACELLYLATCQRVMWMFWGGQPEHLGLASDVTRIEGEAAWKHLMEVATGLVSANLGDREILDQLRHSLDQAREVGTAYSESQAVIEDLLREAQRLRVRVGLADGSASVATASLRHLEQALKPGAKIALVGVGPMTQYLAQRLPERGFQVSVANRTAYKAEALGLPVVPLADLQRDPMDFDALVTATASHRPLFTLAAWERIDRPHLRILDLALPPDSEPALERLPWVHRVDLQAFLAETEAAKLARRDAVEEAEPHIFGAVQRLRKRAEARAQKHHFRTTTDRLREAWDLLESEALGPGSVLGHLEEGQREALEALLKRGRTLAFRALSQGQGGASALDAL